MLNRTALILIILLAFFSGQALAKTDQPADPGSGTGGITITGVTNTTDYKYQAPVVTSINGVPAGTPANGDDADGGKSYDTGTRKIGHMPPEWFICKTADDCGLVPVPCGPSFAVNKAHKAEARTAQCAAIQTCGPKASCLQSIPDTSKAVCDSGECRTVFQPVPSHNTPTPVVCTMEAKACPDGSYVSRTGPHCEFAPCP